MIRDIYLLSNDHTIFERDNFMRRINRFIIVVGILLVPFANICAQTVNITTEDHTVSSCKVRVEGASTDINLPMWYEVFNESGKMIDYGAFAEDVNWFCIVRNLSAGMNKVKVFGAADVTKIESDSVMLYVDVSGEPDIRPRPNPAEIWWGGTANNDQLKDNPGDWEFVKKYADAFFFHTAAWTTDDETIESLISQTKPYGTKFIAELGGYTLTRADWANHQNILWGTNGYLGDIYENTGLVLSEATHDFHPRFPDFAESFPNLNEQEIVDKIVSYWKEYFELNYEDAPYLKHGNTQSPVWWPWKNYKALGGELRSANYIFEIDGREYNFDYFQIMSGLRNMNYEITGHEHWTYYTDFPYYTMTWPADQPYDGAHVREKTYAYEDWLHSVDAKHTFVCNEDPTDVCGNVYEWHQKFAANSFESIKLYQKEFGRADRYLFESWYSCNDTWMPSRVTPEDSPNSYTWLVKQAIMYLKGIKDIDGNLQELQLSKENRGDTVVFSLTNKGDILCLPNLQVIQDENKEDLTRWFDAENNDITTPIMSDSGWVNTSFLKPGKSTIVKCVMTDSDGSLYDGISLEAFWNPQDPTGIVRARGHVVGSISIKESQDEQIQIYPNPGTEVINIVHNIFAVYNIIVTDLNGHILVYEDVDLGNSGNAEIDISSLENGIYILVIKGQNQTFKKKFVKR